MRLSPSSVLVAQVLSSGPAGKDSGQEIRFFDLDDFTFTMPSVPGKLEEHELGKPGTEVYLSRYEGFRHGLTARQLHVGSDSAAELAGVNCVRLGRQGSSRSAIFDVLIA